MTAPWSTHAQALWGRLAPRERRAVGLAAMLVAAALAWWLLLAPALATLRTAEQQHRELDARLDRMRRLQAEAQTLQAQPKLQREDALRALDAATRQRLGAGGQLSVAGDRATVTLRGVPAEALAHWLAQARSNARAVPTEARLQRSVGAPGAAAAWDGSVVLSLPGR